MKNLLLLLFCFAVGLAQGQVTGVDYLMKYNCLTAKYDVSIVILGGSATSIPYRAQFNSQISLVVPTGETVQITNLYMPLQNNQFYTGTIPIMWSLGNPVISPEAQPENDFYGVTPQLSPAAFYNNLQENDTATLFSFTAGSSGVYDESIRFFDEDIDPEKSDLGMGGGDFRNGFTMGGATQLYNDYSVESCITNVQEEPNIKPNIFPSPFQDLLTIELINETNRIAVIDTNGKVYYQLSNVTEGSTFINTTNYPSGIYFVRIKNKNGIITNKKIVKI
jgi:hypothetical protein